MMEVKTRFVLKHSDGRYWSNHAVPTRKLWEAWRFLNEEAATIFLEVSLYRPDGPEAYTITPVTMTIIEEANTSE